MSNDNTLKYFMWGWQPHFRSAAASLARSTFNKLDSALAPSVLLVGFLREPAPGCHEICIEPEDCGYETAEFEATLAIANEKRESDPRRNLIHTHPSAHDSNQEFVRRRSLQRAAEEVTNRPAIDQGRISFCSMPVVVDRYEVILVLQFDKNSYDSHYHLHKKSFSWDEQRVARSYLEATVFVYLATCEELLRTSEPGSDLLAFHRRSRGLARDAGDVFVRRVAHASDRYGDTGDLFDSFNEISAMFYEKEAGVGNLVLSTRDHPSVRMEVKLTHEVPLTRARAVRRLVEISSKGISLLSDGSQVYGLGHVADDYDPSREDLFEIQFTEHYGWRVHHAGHVMLRVAHNVPLPLLPRVDRRKLLSDLHRIFQTAEASREKIADLVTAVVELGHGAQLVISSRAAEEANRLSPQATQIAPLTLDADLISKLCAVDGAVLLDPEGNCHAFGVILDGHVSEKGDRTRGSRFNSAIRYAEGRDDCLIVVVSDDGMIDLVPNLKPQLSRKLVERAVTELEAIAARGSEPVKEFNTLMSWLSSNRFYLSADQCDRVNRARRTIEDRRVSEVGTIHIVYYDLVPDADMNDSYLTD